MAAATFERFLEALAEDGVVTSVCYGPKGDGRVCWSVCCLSARCEEFPLPFEANTKEQAAAIAVVECAALGFAAPSQPLLAEARALAHG